MRLYCYPNAWIGGHARKTAGWYSMSFCRRKKFGFQVRGSFVRWWELYKRKRFVDLMSSNLQTPREYRLLHQSLCTETYYMILCWQIIDRLSICIIRDEMGKDELVMVLILTIWQMIFVQENTLTTIIEFDTFLGGLWLEISWWKDNWHSP